MPAAGWAAESGDPILFVGSSIPTATRQALLAHQHPQIYVLGPPSVIDATVLVKQLGKYGTVKRVGAAGPGRELGRVRRRTATRRARLGQPCAHIPGSFGWAMRSPGHGYVLINANRPLDAAAAAPLSSSGDYGPQLLVDNASTLPRAGAQLLPRLRDPGLHPGGTDGRRLQPRLDDRRSTSAISVPVQAEIDNLLEAVPQATK